jgi:diguanylate cyclase (GGDEF)-like protein/PAS domain S-box-containing protein
MRLRGKSIRRENLAKPGSGSRVTTIVPLWQRVGVVLLVAAIAGAILALQNIAGRTVVLDSFRQLEQDSANRSLDQVLYAFQADLEHLTTSTLDYARWDDVYVFVNDRNDRFLHSNFAPESLENMGVDVVWMIDTEDRDVLSLTWNAKRERAVERPANAALLDSLHQHLRQIKSSREGSKPLDRLLQTPQGLLAFTAHDILPTGGKGPSRGTLLFGRYLDDREIVQVHAITHLPVKLHRSARSIQRLPNEVVAMWSAGRNGTGRLLRPASEDSMEVYSLLRDVNGASAGIVEVQLDRTLLDFGRRTLTYLVALISAVVIFVACIVAWLLLRMQTAWRAQAASERRYRAVIAQAQDTMLLADAVDRRILEVNPAATTTLGYEEADLLAKSVDELFVVNDGGTVRPVQPELYSAAMSDLALQIRCHDGQLLDVEVSASPLNIDGREVISFILRDVSARKRAERALVVNQQRLSQAVHHDALTGLINRMGLQHRLTDVIAQAERTRRPVAFLYVDLDHFKKVNDLHGHTCGDRLLQVVADRLRSCVAASDLVARMGGDEFVVIATGVRDLNSAGSIAVRIREKLALPFEVDSQEISLTSSVGVSVFPDHGADYEVLLKNADIALYDAKDGGRDAHRIFARSMNTRVNERLTIEHSMRAAIRENQFYVDYQPIVDLKTNKLEGLEALMRWRHPVRGLVPPAIFIDVAEKSGMIAELGEFVMNHVCGQIRRWQEQGAEPVPVAINVSARQFERQDVANLLAHAAATAGIDVRMVHVELTESAIVEGSEKHLGVLRALRSLGVPVSIDDFGTGYSSLAYLKNLPIDCLKIDRTFVRDMITSVNGDAIVTAIIRMASSLGLGTIAEGVETLEQLKRLRELGATMGQGFYFSPPLAAEAAERLLTEAARRQKLTETLRLRTLSAVAR